MAVARPEQMRNDAAFTGADPPSRVPVVLPCPGQPFACPLDTFREVVISRLRKECIGIPGLRDFVGGGSGAGSWPSQYWWTFLLTGGGAFLLGLLLAYVSRRKGRREVSLEDSTTELTNCAGNPTPPADGSVRDLQAVAGRIKSLEEEQRELVEYQQLEKQRRCLEYELTDRDWRTAQERIENLEVEKREVAEQVHKAQRDATEQRAKLEEAEAEALRANTEKQRLTAEHEEAERARARQMEELTRAKLELADEQMRSKDASKSQDELRTEANRLSAESEQIISEMAKQKPALEKESHRKAELLRKKQICEAQRGQLFAKQGRGSQYSSVAQRNKALREEVAQRTVRRDKAVSELSETEQALKQAQAATGKAREAAKKNRGEMLQLEKDLSERISQESAEGVGPPGGLHREAPGPAAGQGEEDQGEGRSGAPGVDAYQQDRGHHAAATAQRPERGEKLGCEAGPGEGRLRHPAGEH
ncbi:unnamed protein product [Effrenium voratum]|nr:unnamed protein product [Effrenium voratum]